MRITVVTVFLTLAVTAWAWMPPANLGTGVNTSAEESDPALSADGNKLYFSSNRPGGYGGYDIYSSSWTGSDWGAASNLGSNINTGYVECEGAVYQSTYLELYFSTDRPGGAGGADIWMSQYRSGNWVAPSYCGSPPNSTAGDREPFVIAGPTRVFFSSNRPGGSGGYDIWVSTYSGGWGAPVNLGTNVNTSANEYGPTLNGNGRYLYFGSDRGGGYGGYDIYCAVSSGSTWGNAYNIGGEVNTGSDEGHPCVAADNQRLYFASNRPGGSGGADIWYSINRSAVAPSSIGRIKTLFR